MDQQGRIRNILDDGTAEVVLTRQSACSGDCHKCVGCGAAQQTLTVIAQNPVGARPGERVVIRGDSAPVLKGAAVLYILPLALFFLGYALGAVWSLGALFGGLAFGLGIVGVVSYDRRVAAKHNSIYTIIGYPQGEAGRKGDN